MIIKRSQRNMLKSIGPNIDPCGTPSKISAHELYFELTLVFCLWFSKWSRTYFRDERDRPYALQSKVQDWGNQKPLKDQLIMLQMLLYYLKPSSIFPTLAIDSVVYHGLF